MQDFVVKKLSEAEINQELYKIGFDKTYVHKAKDKFEYANLKIYDLTVAQANILKQTALSVGADCATHREVITGKIETSDVILGASISQLKKISDKLQFQPFNLKFLGQKLIDYLGKINYPPKTKIIGVLNLTQNSFSDGGNFYEFENSIKHLHKLIDDGADIIDIGAESTKPGAIEVSAERQLEKLEPVLKYINKNNINIPVSIDTRNSAAALKCLDYGVSIINDVSGFDFDSKMVDVIAKYPDAGVIIQHSSGTPEFMQNNPNYDNLMDDIFKKLNFKVDFAKSKGIKNVIIDPGIGFGKTREHNFEILRRWQELKTIGCPVLIGVSRKSLLNLEQAPNEEKDIYTLALNAPLIQNKIDYIRVHNVKIHRQFIDLLI